MKISDCAVGGVYHMHTPFMINPDDKFNLCVDCGFFFAINTESTWPFSIPILKKPDHLFLKYDSFVGCGNLMQHVEEKEIDSHSFRGFISKKMALDIIQILPVVDTLFTSQQQRFAANLQAFIQTKYS